LLDGVLITGKALGQLARTEKISGANNACYSASLLMIGQKKFFRNTTGLPL
jgi:hypothetical protein